MSVQGIDAPEHVDRVLERIRELQQNGYILFEGAHLTKDKQCIPIEVNARLIEFEDKAAMLAVGRDISDRKRTESILHARLRLLEFATSHSSVELLQAALDELETLTGSVIGFFHFLEPDQQTLALQTWSTNTLSTMCQAEGEGRHYDVAEAGVWVDCIHVHGPVIHNDYQALPHRKGLPSGHAPIIRELVVPIIRADRIVAILGIGNKPQDYTAQDVETVSLLADLAWDITERKRAEEQIKAALKEKEVLLREIYHRVKNNLMVVKSLIQMQAEQTTEPQALQLFQDLHNRVMAMSMVHEDLYQSELLSQIEFGTYLERLVINIRQGFAKTDAAIKVMAEDIFLDVHKAIPCGLIVAELVTNAFKYAFPPTINDRSHSERMLKQPDSDSRLQPASALSLGFEPQETGATKPEIRVEMRYKEPTYTLIVSDNGVGLPPEFDMQKPWTLGMTLVRSWATHQLKGKIEVDSQQGTTFRITFTKR